MASLRERYKVWWNEGDEVTITTTVKDLITAVDVLPKAQQNNAVAITTAQLYCTLVREGYDLGKYDDWLLVLDGYDRLPLGVEVDGPTNAAASPIAQSLSPVSPEHNGNPGLTMTTVP